MHCNSPKSTAKSARQAGAKARLESMLRLRVWRNIWLLTPKNSNPTRHCFQKATFSVAFCSSRFHARLLESATLHIPKPGVCHLPVIISSYSRNPGSIVGCEDEV